MRFHQYSQFWPTGSSPPRLRSRNSGLESGFTVTSRSVRHRMERKLGRHPTISRKVHGWGAAGSIRGRGQNWRLSPPLPSRLRDGGYARFASMIAANMRHAGALRIDHAMGLARLFWIPTAAPERTAPMSPIHSRSCLVRWRLRVLGTVHGCWEDLGTVPEGFRQVLNEADIFKLPRAAVGTRGKELQTGVVLSRPRGGLCDDARPAAARRLVGGSRYPGARGSGLLQTGPDAEKSEMRSAWL